VLLVMWAAVGWGKLTQEWSRTIQWIVVINQKIELRRAREKKKINACGGKPHGCCRPQTLAVATQHQDASVRTRRAHHRAWASIARPHVAWR